MSSPTPVACSGKDAVPAVPASWTMAAEGAMSASGTDDKAKCLEDQFNLHFPEGSAVHMVPEKAVEQDTSMAQAEKELEADPTVAVFKAAIEKCYVDLRIGAIGNRWQRDLASNPQLKIEYKNVGKSYEKQRQFRLSWAKDFYNSKVMEKVAEEKEVKRDSIKGEYLPPTVIYRREGKDEAALQATVNIINDCIKHAAAGETLGGRPYIKYNSRSKRNELLYTSSSFDDSYEVSMVKRTTWSTSSGSAVETAAGRALEGSPATPTPTPGIGVRPAGTTGKPDKKRGRGKDEGNDDGKTSKKPKNEDLKNGFVQLEKLKKKFAQITGRASSLMSMVTTQQEWLWASSPLIINGVTEARIKVDAFANSSTFWQQWAVQEGFRGFALKTYKESAILNEIDRIDTFSSDLDKLDQKVMEVTNMHNARG